MAVTFVLGRAGTGKTHHCLEALRAELARDETRRLIALVPEQASFQTERALALRAPGEGYWRAEVLSFSRLARRVFAATGGEPLLLERGSRELALRSILTRDPQLVGMFKGSARSAGLHAALDRLIEELLHENVTPAQFAAAAEKLSDAGSRVKVAQLARVYSAYLEWLGAERTDPAQRLALLRARLHEAPFLDGARVWVDGFAGFTGQEVETLGALARRVDAMTITLLVDPLSRTLAGGVSGAVDPLNLFGRTERTYQRLRHGFEADGVLVGEPVLLTPETPPRLARARRLARLERTLTDGGEGAASCAGGEEVGMAHPTTDVRIVRCASRVEELREAARFIRRSVLESDGTLRWSDFAVIARDLEPLAAPAADVFAEFDVPVFIDRRRPMRVHPLGRLVQSLFETVISDFSVEATTRLLRTGLLWLSREYTQQLETLVITEQIRGLRLWQRESWDFDARRGPVRSVLRRADARLRSVTAPQPFAAASDAARADEHPDEVPAGGGRDSGVREAWESAPRLRMVAAIGPLYEALRRATPPTGAEWAATLFDVLERLRVPRRISAWIGQARRAKQWESAETHRLAWEALVGVLDDMHALLAETPLEAREAAALFASTLREVTIGLAPPTLDQVLVSAIERSRHPEIKHAWVIAVNDGIFPARPREDALLTHEERTELAAGGLAAPSPRRDEIFGERLLAYIAFTRPSVGLTISFAVGGEDAQPLAPSPLIALVRSALPEVRIEAPVESPPPLTATEFARGYLAARAKNEDFRSSAFRSRFERLREAISRMQPLASGVERLLAGERYRNIAVAVHDLAIVARSGGARRDVGAPAWTGTLSHISTYLQCPFKFYTQHGLQISGPASPRPAAAELGGYAHAILANVTTAAMAEPEGLAKITTARWDELLMTAVQRVVAELPPELAERRPHLRYLTDRLLALLPDVVRAHAERWRRGEFRPLFVERTFGDVRYSDTLPAPLVRLADGASVAVSGRMDRVDGCEVDGRQVFLAYDYKPGAASVGRREILTDVWLQLFTYLLALRATGAMNSPAGVFVAPLRANLKALGGNDKAMADAAIAAMLMLQPRGVFVEAVAERLDTAIAEGATESPVARMKRTRDGRFDRNADAKPAERIAAWLALAEETIRFAGAGVVRGAVPVAPLVERKTLACATCELRSLCRYDRQMNPTRDAYTTLPHLSVGPAPNESGVEGENA